MRRSPRSTPDGEHRPVLLQEILQLFDPQPGQTAIDATTGWGGHSSALLEKLGPTGKLVGLDLDTENLPKAKARLEAIGHPFELHHQNFAGVAQVVLPESADMLLADLGFSSMQVDDPDRGFSYRREGPLDMRLDRSRGKTAANILASISADDLAHHLSEFGDEPKAEIIAQAIVRARSEQPLETTVQLTQLLQDVLGEQNWRLQPKQGVWKIHPAARTFQALRILVNRELANLEHLLRVLPTILKPGGVAAIISFHSGEDRQVKAAFREGERQGVYAEISDDPIRATFQEKTANPRSRSAKLRWARRGGVSEIDETE